MSFKSQALISQKFDIDLKNEVTEQELLDILSRRIEDMLDHETDLLMSTLYRLDIEEKKILAVLDNPALPHALGLARLILDRQKEKIETRKRYGSGDSGAKGGSELF